MKYSLISHVSQPLFYLLVRICERNCFSNLQELNKLSNFGSGNTSYSHKRINSIGVIDIQPLTHNTFRVLK